MTEHEAARTLVKSPPELWAECSEAGSLARHLGEFGEIKITRLEPETSVEWEAELATGTVLIEPSAWGTRVTLTAQLGPGEASELSPEPEPPEPREPAETSDVREPSEPPEPRHVLPTAWQPASPPRGFLARLRLRFTPPPAPLTVPAEPTPPAAAGAEAVRPPEPAGVAGPEPQLAPAPAPGGVSGPASPQLDPASALAAALDSLGQAHHRPFSRA